MGTIKGPKMESLVLFLVIFNILGLSNYLIGGFVAYQKISSLDLVQEDTAILYREVLDVSFQKDIDTPIYISPELPFAVENAVASCYSWFDIILIRESGWENLNTLQRFYLVMHEIGHCSFDLPHDDREDEDGKALFIMHPHFITEYKEDYFTQYWTKFSKKVEGER